MTQIFLAENFNNDVPVGGTLLGSYDFEVKPVEGATIKYDGTDYQIIKVNPLFGGNTIVGFNIFVKKPTKQLAKL